MSDIRAASLAVVGDGANGAGARRFARQRAAIAERTPELLTLFAAMAAATRALAARNAL